MIVAMGFAVRLDTQDPLDFGNRDNRQEAAEQQEQRQEDPKAAKEHQSVIHRRLWADLTRSANSKRSERTQFGSVRYWPK